MEYNTFSYAMNNVINENKIILIRSIVNNQYSINLRICKEIIDNLYNNNNINEIKCIILYICSN